MISDDTKTFLSTSKDLKKICQKPELKSYLTRNVHHRKGTMVRWVLGNAYWSYQDCTVQDNGESEIKVQRAGNNTDASSKQQANYISGEDLEEEVIIPNHLIYGAALQTIAEYDSDSNQEIPLNKRVRYLQKKKQYLWKRWTKEYIFSLREFHRVNQKVVQPPRLGQLVLVVDNYVRKSHWQQPVDSRQWRKCRN